MRQPVVVLGLIALAFAPTRVDAQGSCMETGPVYQGGVYRGGVYPGGVYPGWGSLSYNERLRRCQEAEQRALDRQERREERDAARELRRERWLQDAAPDAAARRQQECLVNAAACDVPITQPAAPPQPGYGPPPPPPPPPPTR
jgi:hypothetical protein